MNIVILDDYQDAVRKLKCAAKLEAYPAKVYTNTVKGIGQLSVRLRDADVIVLIRERTHITRQLLEKLPRLRLIAQTGRVGAHIDLQACTERGIAVAEGVGSPVAPAELTWTLIMAAMRRLPQYISTLKHGGWQQSGMKSASTPPNFGLGMVLRGRTLGLWGYGKVGQLVAGYGKAFGMQVLVWGSQPSREKAVSDGLQVANSPEELFVKSDVLSLHLRLSDSTRHLVDTSDLARMKNDALLVNTSRAELIAPGALASALRAGRPGAAAIDVFETEPLPPTSPLLQLDNVLATPHLGYVEQDSYEAYFQPLFRTIAERAKRSASENR
jgi:D-3-phosphoglycerate dehydrogenase